MTLVVPESGICWTRPSNSLSVTCVLSTDVMTPRSRFHCVPSFSMHLGPNHLGAEELVDDRPADCEAGRREAECDIERREDGAEKDEAPG